MFVNVTQWNLYHINTMLYPIKVNSNTIEVLGIMSRHTLCYLLGSLLKSFNCEIFKGLSKLGNVTLNSKIYEAKI